MLVSNLGRYWAVRQGPDARCSHHDPRPMKVAADDAAGLAGAWLSQKSTDFTFWWLMDTM